MRFRQRKTVWRWVAMKVVRTAPRDGSAQTHCDTSVIKHGQGNDAANASGGISSEGKRLPQRLLAGVLW